MDGNVKRSRLSAARELYESNLDFRRYVDRYAAGHDGGRKTSVEEALGHEIVKQTAEQYRKENGNDSERN